MAEAISRGQDHGPELGFWLRLSPGARTTVPNWGSRDLKPGTISRILRDLGISRDELDRA